MQTAAALLLALLAAFAPAVPLRACSCPAQAREANGCCCCRAHEPARPGCCCRAEREAPREKVCACSQDPAPQQIGPTEPVLEAPLPAGTTTTLPGPALAPAIARVFPDAAEPPGRATPLLL